MTSGTSWQRAGGDGQEQVGLLLGPPLNFSWEHGAPEGGSALPASEEGRGYSQERLSSFLGFGVMKFGS